MADLSNVFDLMNRAGRFAFELGGAGSSDSESGAPERIELDTDSESDERDNRSQSNIFGSLFSERLTPTEVLADSVEEGEASRENPFALRIEPPALFEEPESPSVVRTPNGVQLLNVLRSPVRGKRFYLLTEDLRARGYTDFFDLKCGSNGCVYSVHSRALRRRVALKVGSVGRDEVERHERAAAAGVAPPLLDTFRVVVGTFSADSGFEPLSNYDGGSQYALVMPIMTPIDEYVERYGATRELVLEWEAMAERKRNARLLHGDCHWGNVLLDVEPVPAYLVGRQRRALSEAPPAPPRVRRMLLIDWDWLLARKRLRPVELGDALLFDQVFQCSQYFTAPDNALRAREKLALRNGLVRYFLNTAAVSGRTQRSAIGEIKRVARKLVVQMFNAAFPKDARADEIYPSVELQASLRDYINIKLPGAPLRFDKQSMRVS